MEATKARIRVNLNTREIEIEGSEDFIKTNTDKFDNYLHALRNEPAPGGFTGRQGKTNGEEPRKPKPGSFAEYYQRLPKGAKKGDKILLAAYYSQMKNPDNTFTTRETTKLLSAQNVKLSNPSQYIKNSINSNRMELLQKGRYRLTKEGIEHVNMMLSRS